MPASTILSFLTGLFSGGIDFPVLSAGRIPGAAFNIVTTHKELNKLLNEEYILTFVFRCDANLEINHPDVSDFVRTLKKECQKKFPNYEKCINRVRLIATKIDSCFGKDYSSKISDKELIYLESAKQMIDDVCLKISTLPGLVEELKTNLELMANVKESVGTLDVIFDPQNRYSKMREKMSKSKKPIDINGIILTGREDGGFFSSEDLANIDEYCQICLFASNFGSRVLRASRDVSSAVLQKLYEDAIEEQRETVFNPRKKGEVVFGGSMLTKAGAFWMAQIRCCFNGDPAVTKIPTHWPNVQKAIEGIKATKTNDSIIELVLNLAMNCLPFYKNPRIESLVIITIIYTVAGNILMLNNLFGHLCFLALFWSYFVWSLLFGPVRSYIEPSFCNSYQTGYSLLKHEYFLNASEKMWGKLYMAIGLISTLVIRYILVCFAYKINIFTYFLTQVCNLIIIEFILPHGLFLNYAIYENFETNISSPLVAMGTELSVLKVAGSIIILILHFFNLNSLWFTVLFSLTGLSIAVLLNMSNSSELPPPSLLLLFM